MSNGKMRWWFMLHDEEAKLQAKWELVEFQTAWKLEPCFRRASIPLCPNHCLSQNLVTAPSNRSLHLCLHILNHHCLLQRLHQMWLELLATKHLFWQIVLCIHLCKQKFHRMFLYLMTTVIHLFWPTVLSYSYNALNIVYFNARSPLPKLDELKCIAAAESPDVILYCRNMVVWCCL
jgi:hypothetical protein